MADQSTSNSKITDEVRRRASEYAQRVRGQYGNDATFDSVDSELAADWAKQTGNDATQWSLVKGLVKEAWGRRDKTTAGADAAANDAKFDHPPTFGESGNATPRNRDEANM